MESSVLDDHDRGLAYDLSTMLSRRRALYVAGLAGASLVASCSSRTNESAATSSPASRETQAQAAQCPAAAPQETAGPYPADGSNGPNVLVESGVVRSDIRSSFGAYSGTAEGVPTNIVLTLKDLTKDCVSGAEMAVYVWHCNRDAEYSLYSDRVADQNYLRGMQVADAQGVVSFSSIFPACYDGRWPHIHFEVFDSLEAAVAGDNARLTSQIALPKDACDAVYSDTGYAGSAANFAAVSLESDNVFGDGWDAEAATVSGDLAGMTITLSVGVSAKSDKVPEPGAGPPGSGGRPSGVPA
jgi:protocatechuate 3,4-dioxygenase beta subunit